MTHQFDPALPVFIVGGGPSLRGFDGHVLSRRQTLAIHHSHRLIPWTDVLLARDGAFCAHHTDPQGQHWWRAKRVGTIVATHPKAPLTDRVTLLDAGDLDLKAGRKRTHVEQRCAGAQAIAVAHRLGAKRVVLLGFDAAPGHWAAGEPFAPKHLPDEAACDGFREDMERIARLGLDIVNATPGTALDCFETADLDTLLTPTA